MNATQSTAVHCSSVICNRVSFSSCVMSEGVMYGTGSRSRGSGVLSLYSSVDALDLTLTVISAIALLFKYSVEDFFTESIQQSKQTFSFLLGFVCQESSRTGPGCILIHLTLVLKL